MRRVQIIENEEDAQAWETASQRSCEEKDTEVAGGNTISPATDSEIPGRHRNWCFTVFGESKQWIDENKRVSAKEIDGPVLPRFKLEQVQYMVHQFEKCPKTGRLHIQGYVQFKSAKKMSALKRLHSGAHWDVRQGTHDQARNYCMKSETQVEGPFEFGIPKDDQGKRSDLDHLEDLIKHGASDQMISQVAFKPFIKYHRGIDKWRQCQFIKREEMPRVEIIYGPSGCGKTRSVYDKHGYDNVYSVIDPKWWDGYRQQEAVLFDEVDFSERPVREWLQILDRYPHQVQVKGGFVHLNSPFIYIISSNRHAIKHFLLGDFKRRIAKVTEMKENPNLRDVFDEIGPEIPRCESPINPPQFTEIEWEGKYDDTNSETKGDTPHARTLSECEEAIRVPCTTLTQDLEALDNGDDIRRILDEHLDRL